jgi:hypothetical protein
MQPLKSLSQVTVFSQHNNLEYIETTVVISEKEIEADPNELAMRISGKR